MRVITRVRGYKQAAAFLTDAGLVRFDSVSSKAKLLVPLFLFVRAHSFQTARENFPSFPSRAPCTTRITSLYTARCQRSGCRPGKRERS